MAWGWGMGGVVYGVRLCELSCVAVLIWLNVSAVVCRWSVELGR